MDIMENIISTTLYNLSSIINTIILISGDPLRRISVPSTANYDSLFKAFLATYRRPQLKLVLNSMAYEVRTVQNSFSSGRTICFDEG